MIPFNYIRVFDAHKVQENPKLEALIEHENFNHKMATKECLNEIPNTIFEYLDGSVLNHEVFHIMLVFTRLLLVNPTES